VVGAAAKGVEAVTGFESSIGARGRASKPVRRLRALVAILPVAVAAGVNPPAGASGSAPNAPRAGVTEVLVESVESPTFGGRSFGTVGQYEKVRGTMTGTVDPRDPRNEPITDLSSAPRNGQGLVEYEVDFVLLQPVDPSKGNHRVVYEPTNRGTSCRCTSSTARPRRTIRRRRSRPATAS
jgi:hypothetical protein